MSRGGCQRPSLRGGQKHRALLTLVPLCFASCVRGSADTRSGGPRGLVSIVEYSSRQDALPGIGPIPEIAIDLVQGRFEGCRWAELGSAASAAMIRCGLGCNRLFEGGSPESIADQQNECSAVCMERARESNQSRVLLRLVLLSRNGTPVAIQASWHEDNGNHNSATAAVTDRSDVRNEGARLLDILAVKSGLCRSPAAVHKEQRQQPADGGGLTPGRDP